MASQQAVANNDGAPNKLRILSEDDINRELENFEDAERARLDLTDPTHWAESMAGLTFTKKERPNITILIGGLTQVQDRLVQAGWRGLGYKVTALKDADQEAYQVGKEFGNRGQCNPTYFTVGNLVKHLVEMRDQQGLSSEEIVKHYVFVTAAACGPCRFGMYATEYRKALREAGFDGFRVILFQTQGGLAQATGEESGLEMTPAFFIAMLKGLVVGDVLNAIGYRMRPYEIEEGATDRACKEVFDLCFKSLEEGRSVLRALWLGREILKKVSVDKTQIKPKVAVIGEFWAMTTEGDGNYHLQRFLESEGCEVEVQSITALLLYNLWEHSFDLKNRETLRKGDVSYYGLGELEGWGALKQRMSLWAADGVLRGAFQVFARVAGLAGYTLPNMFELADVATPYYNGDLRGGEGHLEIGKLILNVVKKKTNMTVSVKPFGCMPSSSVSDGVQSLITEKFPGAIFCPVETNGDGATDFYSRVQMFLFKAKAAARDEVNEAKKKTGLSLDDVREFIRRKPSVGSALSKPPHVVAATTADLVYQVASKMGRSWQT